MDSINPSQRSSFSMSAQQAQAAQAQDATSSSTANSELGGAAQDVGAVISKWQGNMNAALNQWMDDIDNMTALIDDAKSVVNEMQAMIKAYQNYAAAGAIEFNTNNYNRIVSAMTDLGIPESQIQGGSLGTDGYYQFTPTEFLNDIKLMGQYMVKDFPEFQSQLSDDQQSETKDMMAVMFCYNAVKMNEESLTGLLETITSLSQTLMQDIQ